MKNLLGDFQCKNEENIFKATSGNESLHQDSKESGVRIVNFATSKHQLLRARCSRTGTFINRPGTFVLGRLTTTPIGDGFRVYPMYDLSGQLTAILVTIWWLHKLVNDWQ